MRYRTGLSVLAAGLAISAGSVLGTATSANGLGRDDHEVAPSIQTPDVVVKAKQRTPKSASTDTGSSDDSPWQVRYIKQRCSNNGSNFCVSYACADPDQVGYLVERRLEARPNSAWHPYDEICADPGGPVITPGLILEQIRRVGLPSMTVQAPPETFVNYETVVYTKAKTFTRTVNLLGFTVDIEASPSRFRWDYGDGATETTATAGRPYPATDITHTWTDAHRTFHPSVDVTYQIRYRVDGDTWQTLGDTITAQGPNGDVRIREATGMLTNMH